VPGHGRAHTSIDTERKRVRERGGDILSPSHLEVRSAEETDRNVAAACQQPTQDPTVQSQALKGTRGGARFRAKVPSLESLQTIMYWVYCGLGSFAQCLGAFARGRNVNMLPHHAARERQQSAM